MVGVNRPMLIVEIELRVDANQIHARFPVGVEGAHITPIALLMRPHSRNVVAGEVLDEDPAFQIQLRDDVVSKIVFAVLASSVRP